MPELCRVGRTGRAGDKEGIAWTLLLPTDTGFAVQLLQSLALGLQSIPSALHELAMKVRVMASLIFD
jgi:ATP-dependent RNA helicase DDX42